MSDNTNQRGGQDRSRINVNQDYELRDWARKYGVTPERLKEAVKTVGDRAEAVEKHLRGSPGQGSERAK
jgi:Protein of unknown function (DUF3606)